MQSNLSNSIAESSHSLQSLSVPYTIQWYFTTHNLSYLPTFLFLPLFLIYSEILLYYCVLLVIQDWRIWPFDLVYFTYLPIYISNYPNYPSTYVSLWIYIFLCVYVCLNFYLCDLYPSTYVSLWIYIFFYLCLYVYFSIYVI